MKLFDAHLCHRWSLMVLAALCLALLPPRPATAQLPVVIFTHPRTPPDNQVFHHDTYGRVSQAWICYQITVAGGATTVIYDTCNWEDYFPMEPPPVALQRPADAGSTWVCIPADPNLSPVQQPFIKGSCLFLSAPPPNSFVPTEQQLREAKAAFNQTVTRAFTPQPSLPAQQPQGLYPATLLDAAEVLVQRLADLNNALDLASNQAVSNSSATLLQGQSLATAGDAAELLARTQQIVSPPLRAVIEQIEQRTVSLTDTRFNEIPVPQPPPLALVSPDSTLTQREADAINGLAQLCGELLAVGRASSTALARAQGAVAAGEIAAEQRQLRAAAIYDRLYADLLNRMPTKLAALQQLLEERGVSERISAGDVLAYQNQFISNTLTLTLTASLHDLGLEQEAIDRVRVRLATQRFESVASLGDGRFPQSMGDERVLTAIIVFATEVRRSTLGAPYEVLLPSVRRVDGGEVQ